MNREENIAKNLLAIKAVKVSVNPPFTWNTGLLAPIYCDNRLTISYPKERRLIIEEFKNVIKKNNFEFDVIAGTATAAIPWASFLALELDKPMVYVRAQPKDYGAQKQVEGTMPQGSRVLIVEDLISTGRSSLSSAAACLREYDAKVIAVLAIFNYEMEKAKKAFADANVNFFALSNFSTLITLASQENYLNDEEKENALSWSKDPDAWHEANKEKV